MSRIIRIIVGVVFLIIFLTASSGLYEDWLWFKDLGYEQLFWTPLLSKALIQIVNGTILFLFIAGTLFSIRHSILTFVTEKLRNRLRVVHEMDRPVYHLSQKRVTIWLLVISALVSFGVSFIAGFTGWLEVLSFIKYTPFGQEDPVFGKNLGFYFFQLPFLQTIYNAFYGPFFILTFFTTLFYTVTGVLHFHTLKFWKRDAIGISSVARRHLALLFSVLFVLRAFGYYLDKYQLLYSQHGHVVGAGYTDLTANLPVLNFLVVLSNLGFLAAFFALFLHEVRLLTVPLVSLIVAGSLLYGVYPTLIQFFIVIPNELAKETPYIQNEIAMTRFGYGLDLIQEQNYQGDVPLTSLVLNNEQATLNNIRLNDPRPLLKTFTQKQGIRLYYKFNDIDIDRYPIEGENRQVMLSARELSTDDLDSNAKTFVNLRFKYTHGYGVAASFANEVTTEGLPSFAIKDVPPNTVHPEFYLKEPRIYYGELTNDWVVVNTTIKEFDYPQGNMNAESNYEGITGIHLTPFNKLMLSLKHGTARFYLANEVNFQSRILLHRNIIERVQKLAPFLKYDPDPYLIIDQGRLKWIIDAYTTSNALPYSSNYTNSNLNLNYIRNSVKIVVDAYDGTVDFYAISPQEPILQTYQKIFPGVFKSLSQMPPSLKSHLRYPETLFTIQSNMLKNFHMTDPTVFYNKEDAWDISKELFSSQPHDIDPYYTILQIPGTGQSEYVLMLPFTPASSSTNTRNNMIAWMAARMDDDHYGELLLYKLPKNTEVDGPLQVESRIDQDPDISEQLALWNQQGSNVIRGNLLVLPVQGNFIYIEPIYLQATQGGSIPEMKRVIMVYEDKLVMTETLGEALTQIFGPDVPQLKAGNSVSTPVSMQTPALAANSSTMGPVDVANILEQMNQLRGILDQLETQLKSLQPEPSSGTDP
ncbi:UPF0182 family protein [Desulfitobacterium metallireducens]|uniref:UPF0182 protein DESME_07440 n=1 Tax=Desulfitobacterium metallireducens DSM 15288 TaxID=871968 RepID=W0ECI7_9FIRM|nr:UPF0182 family protein [Desulfitobacterium metallireducens]AHF06919.1 hypothetical protein DESME_07440 [Desulfitobacterium metallireducens DSM 15288]